MFAALAFAVLFGASASAAQSLHKLETFHDRFAGGGLNDNYWAGSCGGDAISEQDGRVYMTIRDCWSWAAGKNRFDARESYVMLEVVRPPGIRDRSIFLYAEDPQGDRYETGVWNDDGTVKTYSKKRIGGVWMTFGGFDRYDGKRDHVAISFHDKADWVGVCFSTNGNGPSERSRKAFNCDRLDPAFDWSSVSVGFGAGAWGADLTAETAVVDNLNLQSAPSVLPAKVVRIKSAARARGDLALWPRLEKRRTLVVTLRAGRPASVGATLFRHGQVVARTASVRVRAGRTRVRIPLRPRLSAGDYRVRVSARMGGRHSLRTMSVRLP